MQGTSSPQGDIGQGDGGSLIHSAMQAPEKIWVAGEGTANRSVGGAISSINYGTSRNSLYFAVRTRGQDPLKGFTGNFLRYV